MRTVYESIKKSVVYNAKSNSVAQLQIAVDIVNFFFVVSVPKDVPILQRCFFLYFVRVNTV